jgi:hypothetical protein
MDFPYPYGVWIESLGDPKFDAKLNNKHLLDIFISLDTILFICCDNLLELQELRVYLAFNFIAQELVLGVINCRLPLFISDLVSRCKGV